jgi:hypothetical protein
MGSRRPSGKAMLAAAAALVALGGGVAAAWVAADDDDPTKGATSAATEPEAKPHRSAGKPEPPADTIGREPDPGNAEPTDESSRHGTRITRFPRERSAREQNDRVPRRFAIPPAREFSGRGNARLGNIDIRRTSVVRWSTQGRFELRFGREAFPIVAPSSTGQLIVPAYDFKRVRVIAAGRWKIRITPQK